MLRALFDFRLQRISKSQIWVYPFAEHVVGRSQKAAHIISSHHLTGLTMTIPTYWFVLLLDHVHARLDAHHTSARFSPGCKYIALVVIWNLLRG